MWNPHLGRNDYRQGRLPYINPNQQKRYETMAAEAALYALMTQELTVEPLTPIAESSGNIAGKAYFVRSHGLWTPLYWEDEPIFENEPDRLWQWILQNDDWLTKQGRAFEELSARERQKLPAAGIGDWNYRALSERIGQTKVIAALRKYLFPLAYALKKAEDASVPHGYAIRLLSVGYETLLSYCRNRSDEEDDRFIGLYHTYLTRFVEDFLNDVSWEEAEAFVAWMNAQGVFCAYSAPERLCEYEFSAFLNRSAEAARE